MKLCCGFVLTDVRKCVNVWHDKIQRKKMCKSVRKISIFAINDKMLKILWQLWPQSTGLFLCPFMLQKAPELYKICNINFKIKFIKNRHFFGSRHFGSRTIGPRGPTVRGPTVRFEKVDSWAPDIWAPGSNCPGPNCPGPNSPGPNCPGPNMPRTHVNMSTCQHVKMSKCEHVNMSTY